MKLEEATLIIKNFCELNEIQAPTEEQIKAAIEKSCNLCNAKTQKGTQCKNKATHGLTCAVHIPAAEKPKKTRSVLSDHTCEKIITRGANKGKECGKKTPADQPYCSAHSKTKAAAKVPVTNGNSSDEAEGFDENGSSKKAESDTESVSSKVSVSSNMSKASTKKVLKAKVSEDLVEQQEPSDSDLEV